MTAAARNELLSATALPTRTMADLSVRERFAAVDTWVFDLDNTLYSAGGTIWPAINTRITLYVANLLGLDGLSARALQKYYYETYGTTLRGLMEEHTIPADDFLRFVHDVNRTALAPDPELSSALVSLAGRKLILTNGSREHAFRTAEQLGIGHAFEDIFDIVAADLIPKPDAAAYDRFLAKHNVDPTRAVMFEDIERNLEVPHARGMLTVLVAPKVAAGEGWNASPFGRASASYIDFVTDDLAAFLRDLTIANLSPLKT